MKETKLELTAKFKRSEYNTIAYFVRLKDENNNFYLAQVEKDVWDAYDITDDYFMEDENA